MDFHVSARKWRPQKFSELIGQEHIVRTLSNAIELERVSHAFVFSGTRGVGKTTTARILARVLNCEKGPTIDPCGVCSFCTEITQGNCIDVWEIDGASNNGVQEVRDLIDNVQYSTSAARYKVYIIDEVHMLSKSAFNALLKTLEEPPPRVIFIFATTELIKIPETILSRCQCFEFKPLSQTQITQQLELICEQEKIVIERRGLEDISKIGAGSMRDAQSLLDQVIAYSGQKVDAESVEAVLGIVGGNTLEIFVDRLIDRQPADLVRLIQEIVKQGKDLGLFCRSLMEYLRNLLIVKVSNQPETLLNTHTYSLDTLKKQAEKFHADELQVMFSLLTKAEMEMKKSSLSQMIFEMALLRLIETRPFKKIDGLIQKINQAENNNPEPLTASFKNQNNTEESSLPNKTVKQEGGISWDQIKQQALLKKPFFEHYLEKCQVLLLSEKQIHLKFFDKFTFDLVETPENIKFLKDTVKIVCGHDVEIKINLHSDIKEVPGPAKDEQKKKSIDFKTEKQKSESEIIQDALDIFGGVVVK
ncbi:MAG: DNA polymerase III subunit gamma/tau [Nitrospinota bacterium]|nr:DNA polymerase III subunit gamma/tau [Nitrospinota bacterium]MED5354071.1 DNA polymerase III subunit gamma/tau [Nitrospinota bacterium]MEE3252650.1 DNA polymerase III subunit gamma/tau [Nitrospinota bacterium]